MKRHTPRRRRLFGRRRSCGLLPPVWVWRSFAGRSAQEATIGTQRLGAARGDCERDGLSAGGSEHRRVYDVLRPTAGEAGDDLPRGARAQVFERFLRDEGRMGRDDHARIVPRRLPDREARGLARPSPPRPGDRRPAAAAARRSSTSAGAVLIRIGSGLHRAASWAAPIMCRVSAVAGTCSET